MLQHIKNIFNLGIKELIEFTHDKLMLFLIIYAFSLSIYIAATGEPDSVQSAAIAIVDEDETELSNRITDAFLPPMFRQPVKIIRSQIDENLDNGKFTFVLVIPNNYERDVLGDRSPQLQLNIDATRMSQAFIGSGYIQQIINNEIGTFLRENDQTETPAELIIRNKFNANLVPAWGSGVMELVNAITLLAIILTGAALIRERERGTLEHLLVMPVESFEIMCAKIWSMMFIVLIASSASLYLIISQVLHIPIAGSSLLFLLGVALHLFSVTSLGIFLACVSQNMPQLGMLLILVQMPLNMLSGGATPTESMPYWVQKVMLLAPTTHFIRLSQQILFRGAGITIVWPSFMALFIIGAALFMYSLSRFKKMAT